ncbi:hypothetical protein J27TS7_16130 [Paenibacillus dendritiformis]|uniref:hypothetical protein n=1 Tax=Paenibacillus dendritiformis TaxID=130049 RepID=UPI001B23EDF3|nr:hypothetical protein [Paenibacillus dendritiformis]GIO72099.1 hypothetical protein J27TS7_16130 [Paenibacillus dendritiformis]
MIGRPDGLLIALFIDKQQRCHSGTFVGNYSEFRPDVNLLNNQEKFQKFYEDSRYLCIMLHNCVSTKKDFKEVLDLTKENVKINWIMIFDVLDEILKYYTAVSPLGQPLVPTIPSVKQDAIKIRHYLRKRQGEFALESLSTLNIPVPMELGLQLRRAIS